MDTMEEILEMLEEHDIQVVYGDFEKRGFYHPFTNNIYISTTVNKTERKRQNALVHEAGHIAKQFNYMALYKATKTAHDKLEHEAEVFRIDYLVKTYVAEYGTDREVNVYRFMDANDIHTRDIEDVKSAFKNEYKKLNNHHYKDNLNGL